MSPAAPLPLPNPSAKRIFSGATEATLGLAPDTLRLLRVIESTTDEFARTAAIKDLALVKDRDNGRVLVELFERSMWRETKLIILRELGTMSLSRTTEFLIDVAGDRHDLGLAAEAILALGATQDPLAGEFLLSILREPDHPLHREAVIALSELLVFPCDRELDAMFDRQESELSAALLQYLLLALGRRGNLTAWERVKPWLQGTKAQAGGAIFNAALIAAGSVGSAEALPILRNLDTRYRFFAHHLHHLSMERLELRLRRTVEDAVGALVAATKTSDVAQALQFLREFPAAESWDAFQLLGASVDADTELKVRIATFDPAAKVRQSEDLDFIVTHWRDLNWNYAAGLVRLNLHASGQDVVAALTMRLQPEAVCALLSRLRYVRAPQVLGAFIQNQALPTAVRIKAVNAVVAQAKMCIQGSEATLALYRVIIEALPAVEAKELKERLVRAVGQIGSASEAFLITLAAQLKDEGLDRGSVYFALARIDDEEAGRIICRRLSRILPKPEAAAEVKQAFEALAMRGRVPEGESFPVAPQSMWDSLAPAVYTLLATSHEPAYVPLLVQGIAAADFQTRMLAIAGSKTATAQEIQVALIACLSDTNFSIVARVVDSLCHMADATGRRRLFSWLQEGEKRRELALKILRSIYLPHLDGTGLIRDLERALQQGAAFLADPEIREAATNLRDNLLLKHGAGAAVRENAGRPQAHSLDADLAQAVAQYSSFSKVMKTILRNAELTFKRPDLFDENVDKSTVVVEFVKSIDILLQERIGAAIFLDEQSDLMARMQSRTLQLALDDDTVSAAQLVKELQCGQHFAADAFPAHKLALIGKAIVSGKLVRDQYNTIDGLRAWAMLLLIFGRRFKYRRFNLEPLLKISDGTNQVICAVASDMCTLQDLRNQAAHRATLLQSNRLDEIRSFSFKVLNSLGQILG